MMPYEVSWVLPGTALRLELSGRVSLSDFIDIDRAILEYLEQSSGSATLLVDARRMVTSTAGIDKIRDTQSYLDNHKLRYLLVVTPNKLTRFAFLLMFGLSRPSLRFFDTMDHAQWFLMSVVQPAHR